MRVRGLTRRTLGASLPQLVEKLAPYLVGWRGYFGFCDAPRVLSNLDAWIRRRLRMYLWRQWQSGRHRFPGSGSMAPSRKPSRSNRRAARRRQSLTRPLQGAYRRALTPPSTRRSCWSDPRRQPSGRSTRVQNAAAETTGVATPIGSTASSIRRLDTWILRGSQRTMELLDLAPVVRRPGGAVSMVSPRACARGVVGALPYSPTSAERTSPA